MAVGAEISGVSAGVPFIHSARQESIFPKQQSTVTTLGTNVEPCSGRSPDLPAGRSPPSDRCGASTHLPTAIRHTRDAKRVEQDMIDRLGERHPHRIGGPGRRRRDDPPFESIGRSLPGTTAALPDLASFAGAHAFSETASTNANALFDLMSSLPSVRRVDE